MWLQPAIPPLCEMSLPDLSDECEAKQFVSESPLPVVAARRTAWHGPSASQTPDRTADCSAAATDIDRMVLDDATFEEVVNAHYESLYRFAYSLAQREEDARDLTQEAFAQLARKASQIQDKARIKSWLFTTLYRAFIDTRRWKTRHPHVGMESPGLELPISQPEGAERVDAATAREALMRVDEVFRAPLILFYLEEHSYLEIADILGIPPGTVMSRISRGRAMLRRLMEDKPRNIIPLETVKSSVVP
jgi:RNA polymerase sigma-70 factor (ECF subfamily)